MSIEQIKSLMASAAAAFGARDYATARDDAGQALGLLGAVPDGEKEGVSMEWDRRSILDFLDLVDRMEQRTANVVGATNDYGLTKVNYQRSGALSE